VFGEVTNSESVETPRKQSHGNTFALGLSRELELSDNPYALMIDVETSTSLYFIQFWTLQNSGILVRSSLKQHLSHHFKRDKIIGARVSVVVETLCYKPEGRGYETR
jgi:hypothetical protein